MDSSVVSWCRRLIECRSVTTEGTRAMAELCARELLAPRGIESRLIPSAYEGDSQVNLFAVARGRDGSSRPFVFNTHLDTVPPGDLALWTECAGDPFAATVNGDRIYGLGTSDTKLDLLAKVIALGEARNRRRDVYFIGTFGEEHGLTGAKEMVATGLLPTGALAFVGEPSRLEVITAHKGLMMFELVVRFTPELRESDEPVRRAVFEGRSAHSSTPALGRNAIVAALRSIAANPSLAVAAINGGDAVNKVPARCEVVVSGDPSTPPLGTARIDRIDEKPNEFIPSAVVATLAKFVSELTDFANRSGPSEPDYTPPTLTCNPGVLRSAPGTVTLEFELRPPPSMALDTVRNGVYAIVAELARNASNGIKLAVTERRANPGFRSPAASETVELAMEALGRAGLPLQSGVKTGCTEAGIYAVAGLTPIVIGPGQSTGVIHAPNEFNFLADVEGAIRFYRALLEL